MSRQKVRPDDDVQASCVLAKALAEEGYAVTAVATSMECLARLDAGARFDLLILDVIMAAPHGLALGRMAKLRNRNQKILYVTGFPELISAHDLEPSGAPILRKPTRIWELCDTVRRVLAVE